MKTHTETTDATSTTPTAPTIAPSPAISPAEIQKCLGYIQAVADTLAPYVVKLTTAERRAQTKFRKEGDAAIPVLVRLAQAAGLASAGMDVDAMQQQADLARSLLPVLTSVKTLGDTIGDTVLAAHGESWHTATTLHGALVRKAKKNPALRRDMEVIAGAFSYRKRKPAPPAVDPTAAPDPATTAAPAKRV